MIVYRISTGVPVQIEPARQPNRVFLRGMNGVATDLSRCPSERHALFRIGGRPRRCYPRVAQSSLLQTAAPPPLQKVRLGQAIFASRCEAQLAHREVSARTNLKLFARIQRGRCLGADSCHRNEQTIGGTVCR